MLSESENINGLREKYDAGKPSVYAQTLIADLDTAVSAYLKLTKGEHYCCLLESVEGGDTRGRYSIVGLKPDIIWRYNGETAEISRDIIDGRPTNFQLETTAPLEGLRQLTEESLIDLPHPLPPMAAGIVGYMGYDMVREMEPIGPGKPDDLKLPTAIFIRPTIMAIFDSVTNLITIVTPIRRQQDVSFDQAFSKAESLVDDMLDRLDAPLPLSTGTVSEIAPEATSNTSRPEFFDMIAKAKDYIYAGDIFQVVLSQRFSMPFELSPFSLYRALRRTNPSPYMYHLKFDDFAVVGSSPEILVRLREDEITVRPIAGTRKRGASPEEDKRLAEDLLSDQKELAEHLMLLDLGRNDVGRVSAKGSVEVTARNTIEYYSHVMHIVSNVIGKKAADKDAIDALAAGFPAGTVSGAPKVRAMEIIDELELAGRGIYAGSVGYFSANGSMDTAIVLRTAIVKDGVMHVQAGAGIVADSDPEMEYQECENKARALVNAAQEAVRFAKSNRG